MERQANSMQAQCRAGCGYYGSSATDGLCSVCFKEALKKKQQHPNGAGSRTSHLPVDKEPKTTFEAENSDNASANGKDPEKIEDGNDTKKKNRCFTCQKKVGLTGFECRCGGVFCGVHRYTDKHDCSFDYRALGAEEIRRNNPVVAGEKIEKI